MRWLKWLVVLIVVVPLSFWITTAILWSDSEPWYTNKPFRTISIDRVFANKGFDVSYTIYYQDEAGLLKNETYKEYTVQQYTQVRVEKDIAAPYAEFFSGYRAPWLWYRDKEPSRLRVVIHLPDPSYLGGGTHTYGKGSTSQIEELR